MKKSVNVGIAIIVENDDGKILLGKRSSIHSHGIGTWCSPGGHIKFGENLKDACRREVLEEVGVRIKNVNFIGYTNDIFKKEKKHYVTLFFGAKYVIGIPKSTKELEDVGWHPKNQLPRPLFLCMENYLKKHSFIEV